MDLSLLQIDTKFIKTNILYNEKTVFNIYDACNDGCSIEFNRLR